MICRHCGTEIAEKALICYRCGEATAEPSVRPRLQRRRPSLLPFLPLLSALVLAGLYMGQAATGEAPRVLGYVIAVLAALGLVWWWLKR